MSLAASSVDTWASSFRLFASQPDAMVRAAVTRSCSSARLSGVGSVPRKSSRAPSLRQSIGADSPTPRGSKPTMSKDERTARPTMKSADLAYCTPDPPGPPGLTTSEPILLPALVAGALSTLMAMSPPDGLS